RESRVFSVGPATRSGVAPSGARSMFVDEGDLGSSDRSIQWGAACPRVIDLAYGHVAGCEHTKPDQHWDFGGPDRRELCGWFHTAAVPGAGHDAADAQRKSGGTQRGLLFALQLSFGNAGGTG